MPPKAAEFRRFTNRDGDSVQHRCNTGSADVRGMGAPVAQFQAANKEPIGPLSHGLKVAGSNPGLEITDS